MMLEESSGDLERKVEKEERFRMIAEATGRLPEQQAKVVRLKGEGHSNEEISKELGISISTVKYHYNEALRRIREYVSVVVLFLMTGSLW